MKPSFQMSSDSRFILQRLRDVPIGETISQADVSAVVGRPYAELTGAIQTARRALLRDEHIVFDVVRGVGLKRLNDHEIVGTSAGTARRIKRAARRGVKTLTAISDFSKLTREDQMRHSAGVSVFSAIATMSTEGQIRKIETAVAPSLKELPFAQTLAAFTAKKPPENDETAPTA